MTSESTALSQGDGLTMGASQIEDATLPNCLLYCLPWENTLGPANSYSPHAMELWQVGTFRFLLPAHSAPSVKAKVIFTFCHL